MLLLQVQTPLHPPAINSPSHPPPAHGQAHGDLSLLALLLLLPSSQPPFKHKHGAVENVTAAELQITRGRAVANWNSRGLAAAPAGASSGRGGPGDPAGDSAGLPRASLPLLPGFPRHCWPAWHCSGHSSFPRGQIQPRRRLRGPQPGGNVLRMGIPAVVAWGWDGSAMGGAEGEGWRWPEVVPG